MDIEALPFHVQRWIEMNKARPKPKKKKPKPKKTPEERSEISRKNMYRALEVARERSVATKKRQAKERAKVREKEKKKEQKAKAKEREKQKQARLRAKEKEKRIRHKELNKKNLPLRRELYKRTIASHNDSIKKVFFVYFAQDGAISKKFGMVKTAPNPQALELVMKSLQKVNDSIFFPQRFKVANDVLIPVKFEYIVFRKKFPNDEFEIKNAYLKNELGRLVEQKPVGVKSDMFIYNKMDAEVEEEVLVFGEGKHTFPWIYENVIMTGFNGPYDVKRVYIYNNKVVLVNDNENTDVIELKSVSDAIRFYNLLMTYCKGKSFLFIGDTTGAKLRSWVIRKIQERTGWSKTKIYRKTTAL